MMTHANVLATLSAVKMIVPKLEKKDVYLAYLPMAHILELAAEVCKGISDIHTFVNRFNKCFSLTFHPVSIFLCFCLLTNSNAF